MGKTKSVSGELLEAASAVHLSRQDIADRYGVPLQTTSAWIQKGYGPRSFRVGKYTRYRLSDVLEWEAEQVEASA